MSSSPRWLTGKGYFTVITCSALRQVRWGLFGGRLQACQESLKLYYVVEGYLSVYKWPLVHIASYRGRRRKSR